MTGATPALGSPCFLRLAGRVGVLLGRARDRSLRRGGRRGHLRRPGPVGLGRGSGTSKEADDVGERPQAAHLIGLDDRSVGQPVLKSRENLDALDRVDAEVGVQLHLELEDVDRIPGLLRDDLEQDARRLLRIRACRCPSRG